MIVSEQQEQKHLYSIREVAQLLRVSEMTVRRMIDNGELDAVKVRGQWRIRKASVDKLLGETS